MKLLLPLLVIFPIASCGSSIRDAQDFTPNKPPVIVSINGIKNAQTTYSDIGKNTAFIITVEAFDPDGGALDYRFSSESGNFGIPSISDTGAVVSFMTNESIAPGVPVTITLAASDARKAVTAKAYDLGKGFASASISLGVTSGKRISSLETSTLVMSSSNTGYFQVYCDNTITASEADLRGDSVTLYKTAGKKYTFTASGVDATTKGTITLTKQSGTNKVWVVFCDDVNPKVAVNCDVISGTTNSRLGSLGTSKGYVQNSFTPSTTEYLIAPIPTNDTSIAITPAVELDPAYITIKGTAHQSGTPYTMSGLSIGPNILDIVVTSGDGKSTTTYKINAFRAIPVFKTGQTTSYATGDDGYYQKGEAWPSPRFTDNGNGTLTDNMTGLMWEKNINIGAPYRRNQITSFNPSAITTGGYTDWRLPNILEIESLLNYKTIFADQIKADFGFTFTPNVDISSSSQNLWSSSLNSTGINFSASNIIYLAPSVNDTGSIIPVRGNSSRLARTGISTTGISIPSLPGGSEKRFNVLTSSIIDNMTGLIWRKSYGSTSNWTTEIVNHTGETYDSFRVWRFPNIREMQTLACFSTMQTYAYLTNNGFTLSNSHAYYTSTLMMSDQVYTFDLTSDTVSYASKTTSENYILVTGPLE